MYDVGQMNTRLLTLGAMARRLGVETKWLRTEAEAGLPHVKAGKTLLFDPSTVEQILLNRAGQHKGTLLGVTREP